MSGAEEQFNLLHDPDFVVWAENARMRLLPMIQESELTVSLVPQGPSDIKFAVELGLSIMLDKPIVAVIHPGQEIPNKLRLIADAIVEWEPGMGHKELMEAIEGAVQ